nr:MAG TPA: hypothetical protein [Caudoviricetes sp.]
MYATSAFLRDSTDTSKAVSSFVFIISMFSCHSFTLIGFTCA